MKQLSATILLLIFSGFLACVSVDFKTYLKILNAGAAVEDVNSMPEEHSEKSIDTKCKTQLWSSSPLSMKLFGSDPQYFVHHQFSLKENIYFDVPYSPPELG